MEQNRNISLSSLSDALSAWVFWAEALTRPDADELVKGLNQASVALNRIYESDFQMEQMKEWLSIWPTPFGLEQYMRVAG